MISHQHVHCNKSEGRARSRSQSYTKIAQPKRPSSPHLAIGHQERPQRPNFSDETPSKQKERINRKHDKEVQQYVNTRADQIERLIVRKIFAKQPLRQREHAISSCHNCTSGAYLNDGATWKTYPGFDAMKATKNKYIYQKNAYKHTQDPNPRRSRVILGPSGRTEGACQALERSSTWRYIDDLSGAGRLPKKNEMNLPNQRTTGQAELFMTATQYFAYFDLDESGEMDLKEFRHALFTLLHVQLEDDILLEILRRADRDFNGKIEFREMATRLVDVAGVLDSDSLPIQEISSRVRTREEIDQDILESKVDQLEFKWVSRLANKSKYTTPKALRNCFENILAPFAVRSMHKQIDQEKLRSYLETNQICKSAEEVEVLLGRYQGQLDRAVRRMLSTLHDHISPGDGRAETRRKSSLRQKSDIPALEAAVVSTLRAKMSHDSHCEMRRVIGELFRGYGPVMSLQEMRPHVKSLLQKLDPPDTAIEAYIRHLDEAEQGQIVLKDLIHHYLRALNSAVTQSGERSKETSQKEPRHLMAPKTQKQKALAEFESKLAEIVELRSKQPHHHVVLKILNDLFSKFSIKRHEGILLEKHNDGSFDIEMKVIHEKKASRDKEGAQNNKPKSKTGGYLARNIPNAAVVPLGQWDVVEGKGVYWVGNEKTFKSGDTVNFTSVSFLASDEFKHAVRCIIPGVPEPTLEIVAVVYANASDVISMERICTRIWKWILQRNQLEVQR